MRRTRASHLHLALGVALALAANAVNAAPAARPLTLMFTGDIQLAGRVGKEVEQRGPVAPFAKVAALLRTADLAVGNLECSLSTRGRAARDKSFTFRGRPGSAAALRTAGFDVVTLANNHSGDYGPEALCDTLSACRACGVLPVGAGETATYAQRPLLLRRGHPPVTIAILAFSNMLPKEFYAGPDRPGTNPAYVEAVTRDVTAARAAADVVVVLFHWGTERSDRPSRNQKRLAYAAADAGADLVIGHHPHVLQGLEVRGRCLIAYSLGNFLFPSRSERTAQTMILSYARDAQGAAEVRVIPCVIEGFRPRLATEKERRRTLDRLGQLSAALGTTIAADGALLLPSPGP